MSNFQQRMRKTALFLGVQDNKIGPSSFTPILLGEGLLFLRRDFPEVFDENWRENHRQVLGQFRNVF
ncbi:hypothetical protein D3C80_985530 [compost metagenome]